MPDSGSRTSPAEQADETDKCRVPVVGVGASAGGLEAISEFLRNFSPARGLAIVLVQHLDPRHESMLTQILSRETQLPVAQAIDGMVVEADHVYVIPPNSALTIEEGRLRLRPRESEHAPFMPIDAFFRSLARECGRKAVAIVLSGGGTDGALGLQEVKGAGGLTFVQDDASARHAAMPRSAAATGCADFILPPADIAGELARLSGKLLTNGDAPDVGDMAGSDEALPKIFKLLRERTRADFSQYKATTIKRRIARRAALNGIDHLDDYFRLLVDDAAESKALYQDFLIRVTSFFREPASFDVLQSVVFPDIIRNRPHDAPIRLWVPGCATGEEVYSLAIALIEVMGDMISNTPVKILATDINDNVLERARAGTYVDNIAVDVSEDRLRRFFTKTNGSYQISKAVRDLCVFSKHDVTRDTPFAHLDLISCRNLLIYLGLPLQKRVLPYFHYALRPDGYLVLGTAETIGTHGDLYQVVDQDNRVYAKKPVPSRYTVEFPVSEARPGRAASAPPPTVRSPHGAIDDTRDEIDRLLAKRFGPPGMVIDANLTVLQFRGDVAPYLNPAPGAASLDVLKLVSEDMVIDLGDAIETAKRDKVPVRRDRCRVRQGDAERTIAIEVVPLGMTDGGPSAYLILFDETRPSAADSAAEAMGGSEGAPSDAGARVAELERQYAAARERLQSIAEENEATNEELKAANEEILSSNEELQSTNEELQTAKEEMQSANEELVTVNEELKHRNRELGQLNDDLVNFFGGLNIPVIMVNRELRIRRFTPPAEALFNLIPSDVGRRISDLRPKVELPDLEKSINQVIETLTSAEQEVQDRDGRWYVLRVRPYITADNKIDGAALVLVDIDALKRAAEQLKASRDNAEAIVETVLEPLVVLDEQLRIQRANAAFYRMFQLTADRSQGQSLPWAEPALIEQLRSALSSNSRVHDLEVEVGLVNGNRRVLLLNAHRIFWEGDGTRMILLAIEDITKRKREIEQAELLAREQAARVEAESQNRKKDEFLAMLAHELRNPLAPIRNAFFILQQQFAGDPLVDQVLRISDRQISHMSRLLDDLLDVSRITTGKIHLRRELIELQNAIKRAVESCHYLVGSRGQQLEVSVSPDPIYLEADPARLEQILCNLLNNASKYTDAGGEIRLAAAVEDGWVTIRLTDSGIGIAPDLLPRVFDMFTQADHSLDRSQGGLGIGLTLVKNLVRLHGGTVAAFSEGEGSGSTFVVRLPALNMRDTADQSDAAGQASGEAARRRILVVDDNADSARTLSMLLKLKGHEVAVAHSGVEALAKIEADRPDTVLLDLGLPEMDGFEVAERIRTDLGRKDVLLVAVTGYGRDEDRRRAREAGFDAHLVKPVDPRELESLLTNGRTSPAS
jgi:two-component system, chemotaxis family, CheB/CheR fusion protein